MQKYQGDISILANKEIEEKAKTLSFRKFPKEGIVVAIGEATGHKHLLVADPVSQIEFCEDSNGVFLKVNSGEATLTHEKHKPYTIGKGLYFIGKQWEYDEIAEKRVMD